MMYEYMEDAEEFQKAPAAALPLQPFALSPLQSHNPDLPQRAGASAAFWPKHYLSETKHNLTDAEAKRLLNTLRNKADIEELKKALAQDPKNADLLAEIESGAYILIGDLPGHFLLTFSSKEPNEHLLLQISGHSLGIFPYSLRII